LRHPVDGRECDQNMLVIINI